MGISSWDLPASCLGEPSSPRAAARLSEDSMLTQPGSITPAIPPPVGIRENRLRKVCQTHFDDGVPGSATRPGATAMTQFPMLSSADMFASNGTAQNSMPGGTVTAKAIRHRYLAGELKTKDGSWYARFYDEVPDGNGGSDRKRDGKSSHALRSIPSKRDISPVLKASSRRLMTVSWVLARYGSSY